MLSHSGKGHGLPSRQEVQQMNTEGRSFPALVKEMRRQLALSQEDLARQLGVSYATVNRWENRQSVPSKLAKVQLKAFCEKMIERGKLTLSADMMDFADLGRDQD